MKLNQQDYDRARDVMRAFAPTVGATFDEMDRRPEHDLVRVQVELWGTDAAAADAAIMAFANLAVAVGGTLDFWAPTPDDGKAYYDLRVYAFLDTPKDASVAANIARRHAAQAKGLIDALQGK